MKADKRKHLLTCHYEGQRRAGAVARLREHLAPRCWEGGGRKKKRKEAGFSARQPGGLIHGPRDFAPVSGGLRDAPPVRVAHTRAHTHARSRLAGSSLLSAHQPQLRAQGERERVRVSAPRAREGARSVAGARPATGSAGSRPGAAGTSGRGTGRPRRRR